MSQTYTTPPAGALLAYRIVQGLLTVCVLAAGVFWAFGMSNSGSMWGTPAAPAWYTLAALAAAVSVVLAVPAWALARHLREHVATAAAQNVG